MHGWIVALCALLFAGFILYHSRLDVAARAHLEEKEGEATLRMVLLGGSVRFLLRMWIGRDESGHLSYRIFWGDRPIAPKPKGKPDREKKHSGARFPPALRQYALRHVDLSSLGLSLTVGVASDAAITAQLCGLALTVLESAACVIRAIKPNARVLMRAAPHYAKDCIRARFSCIAGIKIGHLIHIAAMAAAYQMRGALTLWLTRLKTSCVPPWKTSRT